MEVLAELFLILIIARAFGEVTERMGQPSSVGELVAGMFIAIMAVQLGDYVAILAHLPSSPALEVVANVGIFLLVLVAGIELQPTEISKHSVTSFVVAIGGMVAPLFGGIAAIWVFFRTQS